MPFQFRKEAIEEDLNSNFPSQGQGNPPLYYSLSEVVVPTYSINNVTEGSTLPEMLQTAWDFSTGNAAVQNTTTTIINNTGFWLINWTADFNAAGDVQIGITDGLSSKVIWAASSAPTRQNDQGLDDLIVFLRSGDSCYAFSGASGVTLRLSYRQIAALNGDLVNPLGYSAA